MRRLVVLLLATAAVAGCAIFGQKERTSQEAQEAPPQETIESRGARHKAAIDDGTGILADVATAPTPRFKSRAPGVFAQVTFTRVGGDDGGLNASCAEDLIVFSSDRHSPDHNVYVKAPSGKVVIQKTFGPFDDIQPAFSPDGQRIAFASNKTGSYDIWVIETHTNGTAVQVTFGDEDELHPSWTPDGKAIVYSSYSSRSGQESIMLSELTSGEVRDLGWGKFPVVSPDGKRILFQRARNRDGYWYSIWTMNADGTDQTEIVASADWAAINPCWSPDGRFIAFATVYKSPQAKLDGRIWRGDDIFVVGINGRGLFQVTAEARPDWAPCWSVRDGKIYFVSERNGFRNIWSTKPPFSNTVASTKPPAEETTTE